MGFTPDLIVYYIDIISFWSVWPSVASLARIGTRWSCPCGFVAFDVGTLTSNNFLLSPLRYAVFRLLVTTPTPTLANLDSKAINTGLATKIEE